MNYLIIGYGLTGRAIVKYLVATHWFSQKISTSSKIEKSNNSSNQPLVFYIYDAKELATEVIFNELYSELSLALDKEPEKKSDLLDLIKTIKIHTITDIHDLELNNTYQNIDLAIASPGVKPVSYINEVTKQYDIKQVSDIQLFADNYLAEHSKSSTFCGLTAKSINNVILHGSRSQAAGSSKMSSCYKLSYSNKNIFAITGTNGKSTVCALLYHLLEQNKKINSVSNVALAGNYGKPVIDLLTEKLLDLDSSAEYSDIVLELSSYQLALTDKLDSCAAVCLNISPDHLDWHQGYNNYFESKLRVYHDSEYDIFDLDNNEIIDYYTKNILPSKSRSSIFPRIIYYSTKGIIYNQLRSGVNDSDKTSSCSIVPNSEHVYGILSLAVDQNGSKSLFFNKLQVINIQDLPLVLTSQHNLKNLLAVLCILVAKYYQLHQYGILGADTLLINDEEVVSYLQQNLKGINTFKSLPFRCELVAEKNNIKFYNDSKATNLHAVVTALNSMGADIKSHSKGKIILILGGLVKEDINNAKSRADFMESMSSCHESIKSVLVCTKDNKSRQHFIDLLHDYNSQFKQPVDIDTSQVQFESLVDTLSYAYQQAEPNDVILFSPGGASFDSYQNYIQRGEAFTQLANNLI